MHTSPSRQSSGDEDDGEVADGEGVAVDVSVLEVLVLVLVLSVAVGVEVVVVSVDVFAAPDTVEAACEPGEAVVVVGGAVTVFCCVARCFAMPWGAGVAWGVAAFRSCGAFTAGKRAADEVRSATSVPVGVDDAGVGSGICSSAIPMTSLSGTEAA
ncbi:hypothetical protein RB628_02180 [Streptomyces sp. ADMS]|uniref:hypothetical protein n=1 Tax=Streptomyces sp. ADMS TaxID=3071415 RepID=UPI00296EFD10|nr:hypothetical protein [Streptomyces sp. ADMS]MDW4904171.1 hypothetical protein [Streptomyces sp. ADMS]